MGSLMAGWDSRVRDPKAETYQRNRSFTKGEIDAYWRTKKKIEEEHLKAISDTSDGSQESTFKEESAGIKLQRSSSLPLANTKERFMENIIETGTDLEKLLQKNGWWTRSNWAYLNEPPVIGPEGASHKFAAQFHVAGLSASKANPRAEITT
ncbi:hypothetical protein AAG906_031033 [Vitis piasezkii]|nr:uncharacterized protein LOC100259078 [Vitis vinifera]|eukprot:XP_002282213.1 PREDICTED: uncharacterized protein LOC100259078 [Vitis vinifera]